MHVKVKSEPFKPNGVDQIATSLRQRAIYDMSMMRFVFKYIM